LNGQSFHLFFSLIVNITIQRTLDLIILCKFQDPQHTHKHHQSVSQQVELQSIRLKLNEKEVMTAGIFTRKITYSTVRQPLTKISMYIVDTVMIKIEDEDKHISIHYIERLVKKRELDSPAWEVEVEDVSPLRPETHLARSPDTDTVSLCPSFQRNNG
jgi:hypothetical protein